MRHVSNGGVTLTSGPDPQPVDLCGDVVSAIVRVQDAAAAEVRGGSVRVVVLDQVGIGG